ncbi:DNA polymerase/3'-5' exonuclease PolX [Flavihumibacter petaseus]|uniref:DNA polymerase X family protein n=1 Tax=Flavihumibacter petaseus NBRC 106054 TaxID=1220578 RepID=A0A0E9N0J0_9BACT|nr:DNA polymerase/3'-5' exonuclease PolX [Flavihumibacter petaseus]GAO43156.1 DNA polymerase X family protein [Flavihumibacter petaseus NBRC 106054]
MLDNYAIADQFSLLSKLMDIHGENSFKSKSYSVAAFNIEKLPLQLADTPSEKIAGLKGIGDSTSKKIIELLETGRLKVLDDLVTQTPTGILEMMQIKGLGPKKIATIWKEMGLESLGELLYACDENRLLLYKGFGEKTQESVKQSIHFYFTNKGHFLYAEIESFALQLIGSLQKAFPEQQVSLAGEALRQSNIVSQLEVLSTVPVGELQSFLEAASFTITQQTPESLLAGSSQHIQVLFTTCTTSQFVVKRFVSSCSELFLNTFQQKGFSPGTTYASEAEIFEQAGVHGIPVNQRELPETIQQATSGPLAPVIQVDDIKGIIHSHSTWSDGLHDLETMAKACIAKGLEYLVISDHSRTAFYANGLSVERVREQHAQIDELNRKLAPFRIYKSIESDILNDGSLDYPDEILASFDLVIASVHSNLKMTEEKAMMRLLNAIRNPYTRILGHMTGRLLLSRPGYPVDHHAIINACVENKVVIEINAHPRRLDIDWSWIPYAMEKGCLLSIDPDAHQVEGFDDIRYGVISAQKGGLTASRNLSSFSREAFDTWLAKLK